MAVDTGQPRLPDGRHRRGEGHFAPDTLAPPRGGKGPKFPRPERNGSGKESKQEGTAGNHLNEVEGRVWERRLKDGGSDA